MLQQDSKFKRMPGWKSKSTFGKAFILFSLLSALFLIWFVPWVLTTLLGFTIYFPYGKDGESRSIAAAGPVASVLGLSKWASEEEIPKACMAAVVAAEDTRFHEHWGVDTQSLRKAIDEKGKRKRARGASTITQQLVKNLYLSRDRSYLRKARELVGATLIEVVQSKESILTWYWNVVEFGPDVYGITDASRYYFKKEPSELKPHECVSLSVILPSPRKWNASLQKGNYTSFFRKRYGVVSAQHSHFGAGVSKGSRRHTHQSAFLG